MKIKESELRDIVRSVISESIDPKTAKLAQRFIKQGNGDGYTARQMGPSNLFQQARQAMGARRDENGQMDILRSANDIYPMIQRYNAEIKKLQTVYNYLTARQDGNYVPKQHKAMSADQKQRMLASRAANKQARADINAKYGNIDDPKYDVNYNGKVDPTKYNELRARQRDRYNDVYKKGFQNWFGTMEESEALNESLFNFMNRKPDEVDQICQTYRKLPVEQMAAAAQKVGARLQQYKGVVAQLQGLLDKWQASGHLVDKNAELRAQRDAELKAVNKPRQYKAVNEAVDAAFTKALKKYMK